MHRGTGRGRIFATTGQPAKEPIPGLYQTHIFVCLDNNLCSSATTPTIFRKQKRALTSKSQASRGSHPTLFFERERPPPWAAHPTTTLFATFSPSHRSKPSNRPQTEQHHALSQHQHPSHPSLTYMKKNSPHPARPSDSRISPHSSPPPRYQYREHNNSSAPPLRKLG